MSALIGNPLLLPGEGYQISRSVRLRSSASAYLSRTPSSAGTRTTWTWSDWLKRGSISAYRIFSANAGNQSTYIAFISDAIQITRVTFGGSTQFSLATAAVFRDPSAWYHIVVVMDTTNATSSSRVRLFVNGVQQTLSGTFPALNETPEIGSNTTNYIGAQNSTNFGLGDYFDGYRTEINFIDGQALTPSSFGETDAITGVWKPKKYGGTYGTNGFYLNFSDNSAATAAAIGKDYSGNGNNWTPNNISVTSGTTYDSMLDVPTPWADGGNGRGNYATLNPIQEAGAFISNGNLTVSSTDANYRGAHSTIAVTSGKWYAEYTITSKTTDTGISVRNVANGVNYYYLSNSGNKWDTSGSSVAYGATYTSGDIIGVAFDEDAGSLTFYKNNVSQGVAFTGMPAGTYQFSGYTAGAGSNWSFNAGQRPFAYTPPTGFKALHTGNLPEPTIKKGNQYFDATTYTGNGGTQSIVNSGAFQPDLVWIKARSAAFGHFLYDAVRGAPLYLSSHNTDAEANSGTAGLTSFNTNGFTSGGGATNSNAQTYVGWQWKEGATPGFDIVTYTGDGVAGRTVAHSLGVAPKMMIVKRRDTAGNNWNVYHSVIGNTTALLLNDTAASQTPSASYWNNTSPTSSVFTLGTGGNGNSNGATYVAYLFSEVAGFSKFGSYIGNGSTDGPFVFCGFRPRFVLVKRADSANWWVMWDSARNTYNPLSNYLQAEASSSENNNGASPVNYLDDLANGFKLRDSSLAWNASGGTYIFAAFAETPFRYALAR